MKPVRRVTNAKTSAASPTPLSEETAAQAMWLYYREHKLQLITDIRDYRADILAQLMSGVAVEDAFSPYFRPVEPAKTPRRPA